MTRLLALCLALSACFHEKHDDDVTRRLTVIEQRLDAQQRALDELQKRSDDATLGTIAHQLDELQGQVAQIAAAKPAPAPMRPARREPDRSATYSVPIGASPTVGSPKAKVTLVMVGEFACPYCRRAWDTVEELRKKYGADLRVAYKSFVVHPQVATYMAQAACAANRQHKFHELAEQLWPRAFDQRAFDAPNIDAIAKDVGLDMKQYAADVAGPCPAEVRDEAAEMTKLGVGATPSFFINGRFMAGAMPLENFAQVIDEELAKATTAIKKGVKPEKYYEQEIVGKGLKELAP